MFIISGELFLWSFNDDISIKDNDIGAYRYHDKRIDNLHDEGKREYRQKRGMVCVPQNKKGNKLKDAIKYLEEQLKENTVIYCQWHNHCTLILMLNSGLLVFIQVCLTTGDIDKIIFDKYLVGKLAERISDVVITNDHLVCTYNDNQVTLVHFTKPKKNIFDKISRLEPKLAVLEICSPSGRRLEKKIQMNQCGDLVLIWWKTTMNEVYPWSPTIKEHDRANVHLYRLSGSKLELICYLKTEFDPLCITFDTKHSNVIHSVEQKVSRKGEVTIEWRTYEVSQQDKLQRINVVSVPLPTHTSCVRFSPNQDLLLLCCIDGSMTLHDHIKGTGTSAKAAFIPTMASWHSDGTVFSVSNERGQFQHFDIALSCVKNQIVSEDINPSTILDLSSYFRSQSPALSKMEWSKKCETPFCLEYNYCEDSLFLLLFERGPLGILKIIEGGNYSADALVLKYLSMGEVDRATSLLLSMNWDTQPQICMHSLNKILNHLFKFPLTPERESLIQNALGSFHVPAVPISQAVEDEYGDEIRDLTRRFFYHLMRYRLFEKAFRLAIDLNDHDLFMDIHFYALSLNDTEMANAAKEKAGQILSISSSCSSSHSTCSRESCSLCSDSESDRESFTESESDECRKEKLTSRRRSQTVHNGSDASTSFTEPRYVPPYSYKPYTLSPVTVSESFPSLNLGKHFSLPAVSLAQDSVMSTSFSNNGGKAFEDGAPYFNSSNNLMSTSFNDLDEECRNFESASHKIDIVPPPVLSPTLANYIHSLPKKNYPLSRSTPGLTDFDESILKTQRLRPVNVPIMPRQNFVSNILQDQHENSLQQRTYRLNYDLDYIPIHSSCDALDTSGQTSCGVGRHSRFGSSLSNSSVGTLGKTTLVSQNVDPPAVVEKPKVKFSDTVTHILVPGAGQTHRPIQRRLVQLSSMDTKRELAESLPLCLGNEDYLKDFQPLSKDERERIKEPPKVEEPAKIKVVHFGLL